MQGLRLFLLSVVMRRCAGFLAHQTTRLSSALASEMPFSAMDIRVGRFVSAQEHPDSEKLFIEDIDLGEEEPRQIVSGLRAYYSLEQLENQRCLVVANLPKAKLAGIESFGMVLCASENDKEKVEFLEPPPTAELGEKVVVEGDDGEPMTSNQVKKKKVKNIQVEVELFF